MRSRQGERCWRAALLAVVLTSTASCSTIPASPSPNPPLSIVVREGDFEVRLDVPRSRYAAGEAISGITASLRSSGNGPFGFGVGSREHVIDIEPVWTLDLVPIDLFPGKPISRSFEKSGSQSGSGPFGLEYFSSSELRLPPGRWTIFVVAWFSLFEVNAGVRRIRAAVTIDVDPAVGSPPASS